MTSVDLSGCAALTTIGANAFYGCTKAEIRLPRSVTEIGGDAFAGCKAVFVPNNEVKTLVTSSGFPLDRTFMGLTAEDGFYFSDSAKTNLVYVDGSKTGTVSIPASVITIGKYVFENRDGLTSVDLSRCTALTTIGESAFADCDGLTGVDLSGCTGLTTIGAEAFRQCSGLTSVDLSGSRSLKTISDWAFYRCINAEIRLPASVTGIGHSAFGSLSLFCKKVIVPNQTVKNLVTGYPCYYPAERVEVQP